MGCGQEFGNISETLTDPWLETHIFLHDLLYDHPRQWSKGGPIMMVLESVASRKSLLHIYIL